MKLYTIDTGFFKLDGGAMFGVVPKSIWSRINPPDDKNLCTWAMRCLLVEQHDRLILVDTGIGNKQDEKFFSHYYLHGDDTLEKSLSRHGFTTDDITDVFLTHLHFDHCGGCIKKEGDRLLPAFSKATFHSSNEHWEWATKPNDREKASFLKENILPIQESGRLELLDTKGKSKLNFLDGFDIRISSGHTKAMMLPQIDYRGKTLVYMADLLPSQGHIPLPYVMAYDMFPLVTLGEKKEFLDEAADNGYVLYFEHDPQYECCTVERTEKGVRPKAFFRLDEL